MSKVINMVGPFLRSPYNYDRNVAGDESGLDCQHCVDLETGERVATPSLTKQSFRDETDINLIVKRFMVTGELPPPKRMPSFGDFEGTFDFQTSLNAVTEAREAFYSMPAEVRARFNNNPQLLMEFLDDGRNKDEAIRLGLVDAPVEPVAVPPLKVEVVTPPAPKEASKDAPKSS